MTTLEAAVDVEQLEAWFASPEAQEARPFTLVLRRGKLLVAAAPIGIYRLPRGPGESVTSEWPAQYAGPLKAARAWELLTPRNRHVAGQALDFPELWKRDSMEVTVTLHGVLRRRG